MDTIVTSREWLRRDWARGRVRIGSASSADPRSGYEVSKAGTNGSPLNRRVSASMAPTAFLRAVEM